MSPRRRSADAGELKMDATIQWQPDPSPIAGECERLSKIASSLEGELTVLLSRVCEGLPEDRQDAVCKYIEPRIEQCAHTLYLIRFGLSILPENWD